MIKKTFLNTVVIFGLLAFCRRTLASGESLPVLLDAKIDTKNSSLILYFQDPSTKVMPSKNSINNRHEIKLSFSASDSLKSKISMALNSLYKSLREKSGNIDLQTTLEKLAINGQVSSNQTLVINYNPESQTVLVQNFIGKNTSSKEQGQELTRVVKIDFIRPELRTLWTSAQAYDKTILQASAKALICSC